MDRMGKQKAERILEPAADRVNRRAKDSVFVDLFEHPKYLIQLYRILHPEDLETTEEDLTIVTLENLLLKERYNDLGFLAGNRLMILVEAQSTWSVNVVVRFLPYLADTYNRYIEGNALNLYSTRRAELPVPELYVVYTGSRSDCPDEISFCRDILGTEESAIEVRARVIRSSSQGDILSQYITFTGIFDEQIREHGWTREAVLQTLRICRSSDILSDYLREEEVADVMYMFMDKEKALELMLRDERNDARKEGFSEGLRSGREEGRAEGRAEGREEGRAEGREEGRGEGRAEAQAAIAAKLKARGIPVNVIAESTGLTAGEIECL